MSVTKATINFQVFRGKEDKDPTTLSWEVTNGILREILHDVEGWLREEDVTKIEISKEGLL